MEKIFKAYIIGNAKKKKLKETTRKEIFKQEKYNLKKNLKHVTVKIEQKVRKIFIARNGRKERQKHDSVLICYIARTKSLKLH